MKGSIVQKRGNKDSLYIVVDAGPDPITRKRRQKWQTIKRAPNERDAALRKRAEVELRKLLTKRDEGQEIAPENLTVSELADRWLREYVRPRLGPRTIESYEQLLRNHALPVIGNRPLRNLRPLDVQSIYTRIREKGRSGTTALHCHRVLREALQWAVKMELVGRNVADAVDAPRASTIEARKVSLEELGAILDSADRERAPYGLLVQIAVHTGVRLGEALGLRWDDINLPTRRLHVRQTLGTDGGFREPKTKRSKRTIHFDAELAALIDAHRKVQRAHYLANGLRPDPDLVFANEQGLSLDHSRVDRAWKAITKRAGVSGVRFHDLRHAHATYLLDAGVALTVVSERLGHSQTSTTLNIYAHSLPGADQVAANAIGAALRSGG